MTSRPHVEKLVDDDRITVAGLFSEAHAAVNRELEREMETRGGISLSWYEVLVRLGRTPGGRLRMSDLAGAVSLTTSGTTRLVDRIEAAGLIAREACPEDRRVSYAVLTEAGWKALARATPAHLEALQTYLVDVFSPKELTTFMELTRKLRDANCRNRTAAVG